VDSRAFAREQDIELVPDALVVVGGQPAARDSRLIRDDDDGDARLVEPANRRGCAWKQLDVRGIADVRRVANDGAVAIEKRRREPALMRSGGLALMRRGGLALMRSGGAAHFTAARTAAATVASSDGNTVRRSIRTRASTTRAMTAGSPPRRRASIA